MPAVLYVCLGNICRSPMAEAIAAHRFPAWTVDSCGTAAYHTGASADPRTLEVLRAHGVPYDGRARQVTAADFERFDLVLAMDRNNLEELRQRCPPALRSKLHLVLEPLGSDREVEDPYYGGPDGFERVYRELDEAIGHWLVG